LSGMYRGFIFRSPTGPPCLTRRSARVGQVCPMDSAARRSPGRPSTAHQTVRSVRVVPPERRAGTAIRTHRRDDGPIGAGSGARGRSAAPAGNRHLKSRVSPDLRTANRPPDHRIDGPGLDLARVFSARTACRAGPYVSGLSETPATNMGPPRPPCARVRLRFRPHLRCHVGGVDPGTTDPRYRRPQRRASARPVRLGIEPHPAGLTGGDQRPPDQSDRLDFALRRACRE
jgi:hypothetical protein